MKKLLLPLLGLGVFVSATASETTEKGKILAEIPSPVSLVLDIAHDGEYLWVAGWQEEYYYKLSAADGSIISRIPCTIETPRGLTHDGTSLWVTDSDGETLYRLNDNTGEVEEQFTLSGEHEFPAGSAFDGQYLWNVDSYEEPGLGDEERLVFSQSDRYGNVLHSFSITKGNGGGLAWAGGSLWYSDNHYDRIYQIDPERGVIVDSLEAPGGDYPNGMASDGKHLWLANGDSDLIYKLGLDDETDDTPAASVLNMSVYPNPSSQVMTIEFNVEEASDVSLQVLNSLGQQMDVLVNDQLQQGNYLYTWQGTDQAGREVEPGNYYMILTVNGQVLTKPVIRSY